MPHVNVTLCILQRVRVLIVKRVHWYCNFNNMLVQLDVGTAAGYDVRITDALQLGRFHDTVVSVTQCILVLF